MVIRIRAIRLWNRLDKVLVPLFVLGAFAGLVLVLWKVPEWQVPTDVTDSKVRAELANEFRKTIAQIVGGLAILVGVYATWRRVAAAERTVEVVEEGQITDRFTRAIEQLGDDNEAIILGGIYALERIARDSQRDHWQVMEVLTAYVRSKARWDPDTVTKTHRLSAPVQAILDVLGRRDSGHDTLPLQSLDLSNTDLRHADVNGTHLEGARLVGTHLEEADLRRANLQETILIGAHLGRAYLIGAHFERANLSVARMKEAALSRAHLEGADLNGAYLEGADLFGAHLEGANLYGAHLEGANLSGATGMIQEQITKVSKDVETVLPDYLDQL